MDHSALKTPTGLTMSTTSTTGNPSDICMPDRVPPTRPRHRKYYMEDEMLIFLVEDQLFKVHRYFFSRDSDLFNVMFRLPPGSEGHQEGRVDDEPIVLPDVTVQEFECLLDFLYSGMYKSARTTVDDWKQLLSISKRLCFDELHERAVQELHNCRESIDPIERIMLARKLDIPSWISPAYEDLCVRRNSLEVEEAESIGFSIAIRLAKAREATLRLERIDRQGHFDLSHLSGETSPLERRREVARRALHEAFNDGNTVNVLSA